VAEAIGHPSSPRPSAMMYTNYDVHAAEQAKRWDNQAQLQELDLEDTESASEESEAGAEHSIRRRVAWGAAAGLIAVVLCVPVVWFGTGFMGRSAGSSTADREADSAFGEKVLVSDREAAPPTLELAPPGLGTPAPAAEDLHDGNVCKANEELYAGLCYKKCSLLTGGLDSIRTSPWTCCDSHPCGFNQRADIGSHVACAGYDVAGDGSCPHRPGACLEDEELFLGVCYKKCSLLTDEEYPNRVGPATCCKDSGLGCLDPRKDYTSKEFAVGGSNKDTASAEANACGEEGELLLGACYKKCSLLTGNEYPHRVAAATCCKADSRLPHKDGDGTWSLGCLDFRNDKTSSKFNVRVSGHGDKAHLPLKNLTEARGTHLPLQNLTEAASSVYPTHQ